jgi:hypothetical protein
MYDVVFYRGDYRDRQRQANDDGAVCYVEHHFNSYASASVGYAVTIVGSNASPTSKNWGRWYARSVGETFGVPVGGSEGIVVGGYNGRGDANVRYTRMPAVLLEPLFASHPQHAASIRSESGRRRLAEVLADSIRRFFPDGGRVAFSVGHKYKASNPHDRGAAVVGGGTEADYAELVLEAARDLLGRPEVEEPARRVLVQKGDEVVASIWIDEDSTVRWDPVRDRLIIDEGAAVPDAPAS